MKKTIEFKLNLRDPFFQELEQNLLDMPGFMEAKEQRKYMDSIVDQILGATLKTFKKLCIQPNEDTQKISQIINFSYEYKEDIYPEFHHLLEENIDVALNRRIHTSTLERIAEAIEHFISDYSDKQKEEKRIKIEPLVDSDKELIAITNYISTTWNGFTDESSPDFFKQIWNSANHLLRNHFDKYAFTDLITQLNKIDDLSKIKINGMKAENLSMCFIVANYKLQDTLKEEWDYEKNVKSIIADVKNNFPYANKAKPDGWSKMAKNYSDYDGMDELDSEALTTLFGGMSSETAGSSSFEIRTSLPHVMYDYKCQGRKPLEVLVGAIVGHAYVMNENNNSSKMLQELIDLIQKIEDNPGQNIDFEFKEPLNQALFKIIENNGEMTTSVLTTLGLNKNQKKLKM